MKIKFLQIEIKTNLLKLKVKFTHKEKKIQQAIS